MKTKSKIIYILLLSVLAGSLCCCGVFKQVESNEVGVRVLNVPLINHVEPKVKGTGKYLSLPYIHTFYKIDRTLQSLEMIEGGPDVRDEQKSSLKKKDASTAGALDVEELPQIDLVKSELTDLVYSMPIQPHYRGTGMRNIRLKTKEGNYVWIDITVSYQLIEEKAHIAVQTIGENIKLAEQIVEPMIRSKIRTSFGELNEKELINPKLRNDKADKAKDELNKILENYGIKIMVIVPGPPIFSEPFQKALYYQARAKENKRSYENAKDFWEKAIETKTNEAMTIVKDEIQSAKIKKQQIIDVADIELLAKKEQAEATRVTLVKEAEGLAEITRALSGPGGRNLVAREVSKSLQGKQIVLVPAEGGGTINVLDLNDLLQSYGAVKAIKADPGGHNPGNPATNEVIDQMLNGQGKRQSQTNPAEPSGAEAK